MDVLTTPAEMQAWSERTRSAGRRIGVVPTMGALHGGHVALVDAIRGHADVVVVTIFVNPLQFDQHVDFDRYPRPIDDDLAACRRTGIDAVYAPTASTMYPEGFQTHVEPGALADRLEGPMRPGHFRGVATVVTKLFGATRPHAAAFGQKDFQQLAIVRRMVSDLDLGVEIVGVPIVREPDGLAMSSRNLRLVPDDRAGAVAIPRALEAATGAFAAGERHGGTIRRLAADVLVAEGRATVEYVEVVDADTLGPVDDISSPAVILIAAWFGGVRLIDNALLTEH